MDSMKNGKRCDASELVFFFVGFRSLLGHIKRNSKLFLVRNIRRKKKFLEATGDIEGRNNYFCLSPFPITSRESVCVYDER